MREWCDSISAETISNALFSASFFNILFVRKPYCGLINLALILALAAFVGVSSRYVIRFNPSRRTLMKHLSLPVAAFILYMPLVNLLEFWNSRRDSVPFVPVPLREWGGFFLIYPFVITFFFIFVKIRKKVVKSAPSPTTVT